MASNTPKTDNDADAKLGSGCLYIKVSMEGAPYLRKVDLKTYGSYAELSSALEKMFSCFTIGNVSTNPILTLFGSCMINIKFLKSWFIFMKYILSKRNSSWIGKIVVPPSTTNRNVKYRNVSTSRGFKICHYAGLIISYPLAFCCGKVKSVNSYRKGEKMKMLLKN